MFKKIIIAICAIVLIHGSAMAAEKIAVSILPMQDFVEAIVGEDYEVVVAIPPGASPETFEPSPKDIANLNDASIYFSINVPSEEYKILPFIGKDTQLYMLNEAVSNSYNDLYISSSRDPHIWLSPKRVMIIIDEITKHMSQRREDRADKYMQNAKQYKLSLEILDKNIKDSLKGKNNRSFIAFHPAFQYFADDYGLDMHAIENNGKEATVKHLLKLLDLAKDLNIKMIFVQHEVASKQAEAFAESLGAKVVALDPLAKDYINNLLKTAHIISEALD